MDVKGLADTVRKFATIDLHDGGTATTYLAPTPATPCHDTAALCPTSPVTSVQAFRHFDAEPMAWEITTVIRSSLRTGLSSEVHRPVQIFPSTALPGAVPLSQDHRPREWKCS